MWLWIALGLAVILLAALRIYLSMRWGRGAMGGSFEKPENEIQNTTPWKGPPTF
jgi:hypothetical protein